MTGTRVRRSAALGAALALVALSAPVASAGESTATGSTGGAVPTRVHDPFLWQATVRQRPTGPAALIFFTNRTRYFESTGVLVGRDGGYRLIPLHVGEGHGLLSPDGRHYLRPDTGELLDLTTGQQRRTLSTGIYPFAWSPDGQQVLGTRSNDDSVITYGPNNEQLNDPEKPDDLLLVDPYRSTERVVDVGTFAGHTAAAWSPSGDLVAVAGWPDPAASGAELQRLVVVDPAGGGGPHWQVDLGDRRILAGPAAWHPDGRRIALLAFDGCAGPRCTADQVAARIWRVEFLDAATGQAAGQPLFVGPSVTGIVGWRGDAPVIEQVNAAERVEDRRATLAALSPGGDLEVLVTAPDGSTGLAVPGDLLTRAAFGGPERRPSPFAAPLWVYLAVAVPPLLTAALLYRRLRRRRSVDPTPSS
ncbi:hypothetical protein [Micromonospora sp. DT63]|uniref:TolB family protein n=1 Tax=Micromonospora sp. DT63 TaxID=3393441 RepID=UPI003CF8EE6F